MVCCLQEAIFMPFLQNAGQKVNFLFALVAALYLVLVKNRPRRAFLRCGPLYPLRRVFFAPVSGEFFTLAQ